MKITVDITTKTIKIHGSFKYEEYFEMYKQLPEDWKKFEFEAVPVEVQSIPWYFNPNLDKVYISDKYPDTIKTPYKITCSCSQIPLFND